MGLEAGVAYIVDGAELRQAVLDGVVGLEVRRQDIQLVGVIIHGIDLGWDG